MKQCRSDLDRYIDIPNDANISGSLEWWKENKVVYPQLAKMSRDVLAVPASSSSIERIFSISGRIATWQRNRLHPKTISNIMLYKGGMLWQKRHTNVASVEYVNNFDEDLPVPESVEGIPLEWANQWWLENVKGSKVTIISEKVRSLFETRGD